MSYDGYTYTWDMARQLKSISNGTNTYSYTYNEDGIRTSKTVNGVTTHYVVENKLTKAEYTDNYSIVYWYDENNSIIGFFYTDKTVENPKTETYIYTKNTLGDIIGILNSEGAQVVMYSYDAWGNILTITGPQADTIGVINPIRYREYYFDNETSYYYLQSRYYNPVWHRFINADETSYIGYTETLISINAFAYCENNPTKLIDFTGHKPIDVTAKLTNTMLKNAMYLYSLARLSKYVGFAGKLALLYKFYTLVKSYGKWDFKNQKEWKIKKKDYYTFMGIKIKIADIGNIHFGFVGSVIFSWYTLCAGAGLYQIYSKTSSWKFWYTFFDDPRDTVCITIGRSIWYAIYRKWVYQW